MTVLFPPKATVPERLLVPVLVSKVPPLMVNASAPTLILRISSVAPLAIVVPAAVVQRADALVIAKVPALTVVLPV